MDNYPIEPATDEERTWAARLFAGTDPWIKLGIPYEKLLQNCYDPGYLVYIAHDTSGYDPCGVVIIDPRGLAGSPYIKSVAVDTAFRSQGLGAAMIRFAENLFRDRARFMFICVSAFNIGARRLYESMGYSFAGEFADYIVDGESEILLSKRLAP
jgi:ribosomal-protein-alanine N-acetyltransferase